MYIQHGLGDDPWYKKALDIASQAGAGIVGSVYGPGAATALQQLHKGWTGLVFGSGDKPAPMPQAAPPPPAPRPASAPAYVPAPTRAPQFSPSQRPSGMRPPMTMPMVPPEGSGPNWLLIGGLGAGAVVLYLLLRKPKPAVPGLGGR